MKEIQKVREKHASFPGCVHPAFGLMGIFTTTKKCDTEMAIFKAGLASLRKQRAGIRAPLSESATSRATTSTKTRQRLRALSRDFTSLSIEPMAGGQVAGVWGNKEGGKRNKNTGWIREEGENMRTSAGIGGC